MEEDKPHKPHRPRKSGRKAEKKAKKHEATRAVSQAGMTAKQRNPKAFAVQNVTKLKKTVRRTLDIKEKKVHDPVVDRTPLEPPPIIVAVVGPPKVGKSTLLRGLIKNYSSQKLANILGPVTVVSGKKRRLTFIECNNDMNSMIDIAKVADLVLLLIDASFGMEMETFEFLNICQVHGFPRIMGVLTHLDYFKDNKKLKTVRKTLKHRFWTEIYQGAKLFYLSGMIHGEYLKNDVHNLARFISVMKFRPLTWRNSHPYVLADRMEDISDPEKLRINPKMNRTVCFYGWMRGVPLKNKSTVHIPGCGDYLVSDVSNLPDPCPLPDLSKRRSLNDLERKLYAPFSGVGGIVYDKDAVYIDMGNRQPKKDVEVEYEDKGEELKAALIGSQLTLQERMTESSISLLSDGRAITSQQFADESSKVNSPAFETLTTATGRTRRRAVFNTAPPIEEETMSSGSESSDDDDDDDAEGNNTHSPFDATQDVLEENEDLSFEDVSEDDANNKEDEGQLKWKENLVAKASKAFLDRQKSAPNLRKLVYEIDTQAGEESAESKSIDDVGGMFKVISRSQRSGIDNVDYTRLLDATARDWSNEEMVLKIKDCFVTGEWESSKDAQKLLDEDDDLYGDFEDLEQESSGEQEENNSDVNNEDSDTPVDGNQQKSKKISKEERRKKIEEKRLAKKQRIKEMFDAEYDKATDGDGADSHFDSIKANFDKQANLNKTEFDGMDDDLRVLYEGYRAGLYVRVEIQDMPCEFVEYFDPSAALILGGMTSSETVIGCLQARFKKHRWYGKILKTKDPVIFSLGWRRFQSLPLYTIQDHNGRNRHLKYTPEHMHCNAIFWGPSTPQNTGLLCLQSYSADQKGFRVCATGVILSQDKSMAIMKKLKLIGYPEKVHKKTAFIKDMFSSQLEVAKFEGAKIKTVSGIRGQVKKALRTPEGAFRATFEDSILMSDIVFLKTWYQVELPKFFNPVTNFIMPPDKRAEWQGMKTLGMLRKETGSKALFSKDSQYQKEPVRKQHHLKPFTVPRKLQKDLPFDYKPKVRGKWEDPITSKRVAVIRDTHEKKRDQLLNQMRTIHTVKEIKSREDGQQRHRDYRQKKKAEEAAKDRVRQRVRKELYTKLGKIKEKVHKKMNFNEADE